MGQKIDLILQYIANADGEDMNRIIEAVIRKCDAATPETETIFLSLPKEKGKRRAEYLQKICHFLWYDDYANDE